MLVVLWLVSGPCAVGLRTYGALDHPGFDGPRYAGLTVDGSTGRRFPPPALAGLVVGSRRVTVASRGPLGRKLAVEKVF